MTFNPKKPARTKGSKSPVTFIATLETPLSNGQTLIGIEGGDVCSWFADGVFHAKRTPCSLDLENYEPELPQVYQGHGCEVRRLYANGFELYATTESVGKANLIADALNAYGGGK